MSEPIIGDSTEAQQAANKLSITLPEFEKLEREFKAELESLVGERSLSRFQGAYERLYRALKTCYVSE